MFRLSNNDKNEIQTAINDINTNNRTSSIKGDLLFNYILIMKKINIVVSETKEFYKCQKLDSKIVYYELIDEDELYMLIIKTAKEAGLNPVKINPTDIDDAVRKAYVLFDCIDFHEVEKIENHELINTVHGFLDVKTYEIVSSDEVGDIKFNYIINDKLEDIINFVKQYSSEEIEDAIIDYDPDETGHVFDLNELLAGRSPLEYDAGEVDEDDDEEYDDDDDEI